VVIAGAGLPGATAVSNADWIHVTPVRNSENLAKTISKIGLGAGEVSTAFLAKELAADLTLIDEWKGRRLATEEGLAVVGCVGILEELYRRNEIKICDKLTWIFSTKTFASICERCKAA